MYDTICTLPQGEKFPPTYLSVNLSWSEALLCFIYLCSLHKVHCCNPLLSREQHRWGDAIKENGLKDPTILCITGMNQKKEETMRRKCFNKKKPEVCLVLLFFLFVSSEFELLFEFAQLFSLRGSHASRLSGRSL